MSKPWLRLWDKTLDSHKAQSLDGETFKGWVNLMCLANRQPDRGRLPGLDAIAFSLRLTPRQASKLVDSLVKIGLIDRGKDGLTMHDWDEWQPEYDSSTERTRAYRDRKRAGDGRVTSRDVTASSQTCHGDVSSDAPDTDTDTEREKTPLNPPSGGRRRKADPAPFVPPDWVPSGDWDAFVEMRRKIGKKLTDEGKQLAIKKLAKLRDDGDDPAEVLQQSVLASWQGLFPVHATAGRNGHAPARREDKPIKFHRKGDPL